MLKRTFNSLVLLLCYSRLLLFTTVICSNNDSPRRWPPDLRSMGTTSLDEREQTVVYDEQEKSRTKTKSRNDSSVYLTTTTLIRKDIGVSKLI